MRIYELAPVSGELEPGENISVEASTEDEHASLLAIFVNDDEPDETGVLGAPPVYDLDVQVDLDVHQDGDWKTQYAAEGVTERAHFLDPLPYRTRAALTARADEDDTYRAEIVVFGGP